MYIFRELVDSLCRDGDAQYMQYLSKNHITSPQTRLFKCLVFLYECHYDQQDSYKCPKAIQKTAKCKSVWLQKCDFSSSLFFSVQQQYLKNSLSTHCHFITKLMLITARGFMTIQHLHSYKFTLVDKTVHSSAWLLSIA